MTRTRLGVAAFLSIVLGLLVGLGVGALAWGSSSSKSGAAKPPVAMNTRVPVLKITRHVDVGAFVWVIDARDAAPDDVQGTQVRLVLKNVQPFVHGFSAWPGDQVVAIPLDHFFGTGSDAYDFALPDSHAAIVRTTGPKGNQQVETQVISAQLLGDNVALTLGALSKGDALKIVADTPEPISVVIDGGPLGLRH